MTEKNGKPHTNESKDFITKLVHGFILLGIPATITFVIKINAEVAVLKEGNANRKIEIQNISNEMKELNSNVQAIKEKVIVIENNDNNDKK